MKTAEEYVLQWRRKVETALKDANYEPDSAEFRAFEAGFYKQIQLDAFQAGMQKAAEIANSLAKHNVGQDWQKEKRNLDLYHMGIGQEQATSTILTAAEQLTIKDI